MAGRVRGAFGPHGCVLVTVALDALADGLSPAEIIRHYPSLTDEGVRAAAAYDAWLAKQEVMPLVPGQ